MKLGIFIAAAALAVSALPAAAAVPLVNSPITVLSTDLNKAFTYNFNGIVDEQNQSGLQSAITFALTGVSGNTWTFSADIKNNLSVAPVSGRITSFGFSGNPSITAATPLSGPFMKSQIGGSFPQTGGGTTIGFCLEDQAGGGCGGGGNGVFNNTTAISTFSLSFANPITSVTFNDFIVRYQTVTGSRFGDSGIGLGTGGGGFDPGGGEVPEPATWAMLLTGFGLVGFAARRRRALHSVSA